MWLEPGVAVAVASSCGFDWTPSLRTSICCGSAPPKQKEKKKKEEDEFAEMGPHHIGS